MAEYDFKLTFALPRAEMDPEDFLDALFEYGCDDAVIGVGEMGHIALDFDREADSAEDAIYSAIADVQRAIPGATLIEATPDLVGVTDLAGILNISRQGVRQMVLRHRREFPTPVHFGSPSFWHLSPVLDYLSSQKRYRVTINQTLKEVSEVTATLNLVAQKALVDKEAEERASRALGID